MFFQLRRELAESCCRKIIEAFKKDGVDATVWSEQSERMHEADVLNSGFRSYFVKPTERPGGQMFGVLVCRGEGGEKTVLKAFSGQYDSLWNIKGWVPPLLSEKEFARITEESDVEIHRLTDEIEALESTDELTDVLGELRQKRQQASKKSMEEIFSLYKVPVLEKLEVWDTYEWTNPRNGRSYPKYKLRPVYAEKDIFSFYGNGRGNLPPTGAGECCAPKLLAEAVRLGLRPVSLAEFYYGDSSNTGVRVHGQFYPPCDEKCGPLLPAMLGLKILYFDSHIVVVEKPSGLLSVPGRGPEKQDCVVNRVKFLFGGDIGWRDPTAEEKMAVNGGSPAEGDVSASGHEEREMNPFCIEQPSVHRLDMETSGLLVLAFTAGAHAALSRQFEEGSVFKQYQAVLAGVPECIKKGERSGRIELPFRLDPDHRPLQVYDEIYGKVGITDWEFLRFEKGGRVRMLYTPRTGRTHQLRLHSADAHGFGVPIVGDTLYGRRAFEDCSNPSAEKAGGGSGMEKITVSDGGTRLLLHSCTLEFTHPVTGERMKFHSEPEF